MRAVCPNPTIDRVVVLDELVPGMVGRARANYAYPAGKSVSAARGCLANGADPQVDVLLPMEGSGWYLETLAAEGMRVINHRCNGSVRESIIIVENSGRTTVLNGPGAPVSPESWQGFVEAACAELSAGEWVISSGSFPPGVEPDEIAGFVAALTATGARLALDTGPLWMGAALAGSARPTLITPNLAEAEAILSGASASEPTGNEADALGRAAQAAAALRATGVTSVVVTAGAAGLAWAADHGSGQLVGQSVAVRNPIGSGDAFAGGLVARLDQGVDFADAVAWGLATAAASVEQWAPGRADPERVSELHRLVSSG